MAEAIYRLAPSLPPVCASLAAGVRLPCRRRAPPLPPACASLAAGTAVINALTFIDSFLFIYFMLCVNVVIGGSVRHGEHGAAHVPGRSGP